jgi:hypothetical protein
LHGAFKVVASSTGTSTRVNIAAVIVTVIIASIVASTIVVIIAWSRPGPIAPWILVLIIGLGVVTYVNDIVVVSNVVVGARVAIAEAYFGKDPSIFGQWISRSDCAIRKGKIQNTMLWANMLDIQRT